MTAWHYEEPGSTHCLKELKALATGTQLGCTFICLEIMDILIGQLTLLEIHQLDGINTKLELSTQQFANENQNRSYCGLRMHLFDSSWC